MFGPDTVNPTPEQLACPHIRVDVRLSKDGHIAYFHEERRCPDCGLVETSHYGSWKTTLGKSEYKKIMHW